MQVVTASSAGEGLELFKLHKPHVVVLDIYLPDRSGMETYQQLRTIDARTPVIFITGHGTTDTAIEAMKSGAFDYLLKPLELGPLRDAVQRAMQISRLSHTPAVLSESEDVPDQADALIGRCPSMQEVYKAIGRVASQDVTVLLLGESGTGKELVARAIYQHSRRSNGPFLAINCAAIPDNLLESELFGHEKGAFTGADRKRIGKFEQCSGGTLFLDEIGDMAPLTQTKLLRLLQEQRFERVGGNETVQTDVRLIAATNRDLEQLVTTDHFRKDLFYRLNVFTISMPPLRERPGDLSLLVEHLIKQLPSRVEQGRAERGARNHGITGTLFLAGQRSRVAERAQASLAPRDGPRAHPRTSCAALRLDERPPESAVTAAEWERFVRERLDFGSEDLYAEALASMERQVLTIVLRHTEGNQVQAARILGITRGSLRNKIRSLGITIGRSVWSEENQPE